MKKDKPTTLPSHATEGEGSRLQALRGIGDPILETLGSSILDGSRFLIVGVDASGRVTFTGARFLATVGLRPDQVIAREWISTFLPPDDQSAARRDFDRLGQVGEVSHARRGLLAAGGTRRIVDWDQYPVRDEGGRFTGAILLGHDATEHENVVGAFHDSVWRYQAIVNNAVDAIITIDEHGMILSFNRAAERMFGWRAVEVVGSNVSRLMPSPYAENHDGYLAAYMTGGEPKIIGIGREVRGLRKDGTEFPLQLGVSEIHVKWEKRSFAGLCQDLTERMRVEAELRQANDELVDANRRLLVEQSKQLQSERLSSIGLLASGMAHEVNNPLMGVISCVKALREGSVAGTRRDEYFEAVREGLERIQLTVRSLLDYARQRPPAPSHFEPAELIESCLRLLVPAIRKKDLEVSVRIDDPGATVYADRSQIMQALANLLLNAIYAVDPSGKIAVVVSRAGERVGLTVEDNGPGIDTEILDKVCDPFFTTKPIGEGTGLGLAVTLGIARAHDGELQIRSEPDAGTSITLWLPSRAGA